MFKLQKQRRAISAAALLRRPSAAVLLATLTLALLAWCLFPVQTAQAHGGVIISSGYTERYEWLVAISPYPTTEGATVLTLLVYDINSHKPVLDLQGGVLLAAPEAPRPCCQSGVHLGPFGLFTDPQTYPGDYSTTVVLNGTGGWEAQFTVDSDNADNAASANSAPLQVVVPFEVITGTGGKETEPASQTQRTPLFAGNNWWLWGGLALVPLALVLVWALRGNTEE